jgi:hypothetical protein
LEFLIGKRYIGGKHLPERKLLVSRTRWASKEERRSFQKEYDALVNEGFIGRQNKRSGKSSEPHISLNPHKLAELHEMMNKN